MAVTTIQNDKYAGPDRRSGVQREQIYDKVNEIHIEQKLIRNDLCDVCKKVESHDKLFHGNGKEGLVTTVSKLVDAVNDIKKLQWFVALAIIGLIVEKIASLF